MIYQTAVLEGSNHEPKLDISNHAKILVQQSFKWYVTNPVYNGVYVKHFADFLNALHKHDFGLGVHFTFIEKVDYKNIYWLATREN